MYQNETSFSIKQYILTTSCLDILIDGAFFFKQTAPSNLFEALFVARLPWQ